MSWFRVVLWAMDVSGRREELVGLLRRRNNATADELARELGVSVRTVFRDLDAMRTRGFAIDGTVGRGGGVQLDPTTVLLTTQLTTEEVVALLLSDDPSLSARTVMSLIAATADRRPGRLRYSEPSLGSAIADSKLRR